MKYNPNPKMGEPVRFRLPSGEIVDGTYGEKIIGQNSHAVLHLGSFFIASSKRPKRHQLSADRVRFVYPVEQMK